MPAQRFQLESIAYESIEAFEAFAHVRGSQGQINPGGRPDAKHRYTLSKTFSSRSKVPESKSARTWILRPLDNTTSRAHSLGVSACRLVPTNATGTNRLTSLDSTLPKRRLFKCRCRTLGFKS
jgi:hypothetical protein